MFLARAVEGRQKELSVHRKILTWGKEPILEWIQKKFGKLVSLKSAAEEAGLLKLETMSNWTNEILGQDQIIYAALDCVAMVRIAEHFKIPQSKKVIHNPLSTLGPHADGIHNSRGSEHSLSLWHPREESTDMPTVLFVASRGSESTPLPSMESR
ncbi:hypothetical protein B9Z55_007859 [Caenorhabditis nigoni]|nr:hypothetical protein B9Z55_007859 [Caenorhabditis nigoni]